VKSVYWLKAGIANLAVFTVHINAAVQGEDIAFIVAAELTTEEVERQRIDARVDERQTERDQLRLTSPRRTTGRLIYTGSVKTQRTCN